jgi:photosystem II stability/assembly factor-like uncharacterized protein
MWHCAKTTSILFISLLLSLPLVASESKNDSPLSQIAQKASERLLMDIVKIHNGRLLTVGERGHVLISDDNGNSWRQVQVPTQTLLTKLYFIDEKIGWAVGHQQMILKTTDAGETWLVQNQSDSLDQPAIFDIWFADSKSGIAVGAYGLFLTTDDGGETWSEVYQESLEDPEIGFPHFYSVAFEKKSQKLFLAAELGLLAVSNDFGNTWTKLESPYNGSFFHISALTNGVLVTMGLRGHLFRSSDLGESWQAVETGTFSGLQNLLVSGHRNKLIIVGSNGTQLVSDDNAKSVRLIQRSDRVHLSGAVETADNQLLLVGNSGVLTADLK